MASFQITPPEPFSFATPNDWPSWKKRFLRFRTASGLDAKPEAGQVDALVYLMGPQAEEIFNTFKLEPAEQKKFEVALNQYEAYFIPRRNIIYERAKFNTRTQQEGESVEDFVTALHTLSTTCNYGDLREDLIRDRLVVGLQDHKVSRALQLDPDLNLQKALLVARQHETVNQQQEELHGLRDEQVSLVQGKRRAANFKKKAPSNPSGGDSSRQCGWCGKELHNRASCPAKEAFCRKCGKKGHFEAVCRSSRNVRNVDNVDEEAGFLGVASHSVVSKWEIPVLLESSNVIFKIDTGADETVIPEELFVRVCPKTKLQPARRRLQGPDGKPLAISGMATLSMTFAGSTSREEVYVLRGLRTPLLGKPAIEKLSVLAQVDSVKTLNPLSEFAQVFQGLGTFEEEYDLKLKSEAKPFALTSPRRVPLPLFQKTRQELERMQALGVISPVTEPTTWCAPMVVVPKTSGAVRICVDFTELNRYVRREWHPIPAVEYTIGMLRGASTFSKLDANSGFWQIPLSEKSKEYTTFITPFGRFYFNRLPFGVSSAPEHFQRRMGQVLSGMEGVVCHMDDVLIWGATQAQHDERLRAVLKRVQTAGITLNREKCEFNVTEISFLGHKIGCNEVRPDKQKLAAVTEMRHPTSKTELRRMMGMATYLARFVPRMAEVLQPLSSMISSRQEFVWGPAQEEAFQNWKTLLSSDPVLGIYDPNRETVVSADASSYGLGAVLRQKQDKGQFKVISYASRTLTDTERRYAQIEKEGLALVWASEKFRDYLLGTQFCLETDHKPLVSLFGSKGIDELTPRLQRMRMRLMRYTYDIVYVPGRDLTVADTLSRSPLQKAESTELEDDVQGYLHWVASSIPVTAPSLQQIAEEQKRDPVCQALVKLCAKGWPSRRDVGLSLKSYWEERQNIAVNNDVLMCGSRIVIPSTLRQPVLEIVHEGHFGIEKCRGRAKSSVWWPSIDADIERLVKNCHSCLKQSTNRKMPLQQTEFPDRPWQRIAIDLFFLGGKWWVVMTDYFSRYPELAPLSSLSSSAVINHCKSIFARHGIPEVVVSDNGPQFSRALGAEFSRFAREYNFRHVTSSPHYHQSNGMAESAVKIIKGSLKKTGDAYKTLLSYRTSPLKNGFSPAELLMGRRLRTALPTSSESLQPRTPDLRKLAAFEKTQRCRQKKDYDRRHGVRDLSELSDGTEVWIIDLQRKGIVQGRPAEPRSYWVETDESSVRRNRTHLIPLPATTSENRSETVQVAPESAETSSDQRTVAPQCNDTSHTHTRSGRCVVPPARFQAS